MISVAPVRKQVLVSASQPRAFAVFTADMSRWWPATHSITKSRLVRYVLEPRAGGRWYAVGEDGENCETGYVIEWQPPQLLVLAWQLNGEWQYDPKLVTEVEVRFIAEGQNTTRVELQHRNLERMADAAQRVRGMVDAPGGWSAILQAFKNCVDT